MTKEGGKTGVWGEGGIGRGVGVKGGGNKGIGNSGGSADETQ